MNKKVYTHKQMDVTCNICKSRNITIPNAINIMTPKDPIEVSRFYCNDCGNKFHAISCELIEVAEKDLSDEFHRVYEFTENGYTFRR